MKCSFILFNQLIVVMEKYKALYFLNVSLLWIIISEAIEEPCSKG